MIKREEATIGSVSFANILFAVARGVAGAYIFLIIAFGILSLVYTYTSMADSLLSPVVTAITLLSLVVGGFVSSKRARSLGWLHGVLTGAVYTIIRILLGIAVFKNYVPDSSPVTMFLVAMLLSAIGAIAGINLRKN